MSYHVPVLYEECLSYLDIKQDGIYFDGTLGGAGHSEGILMAGGKLIATDLDIEAINNAKVRLNKPEYTGRFNLVKDNFKNFLNVLDILGVDKIDGALLDLGISSHQIDEPTRGFSYRFDGRLDMRMNESQRFSAYDVVNTYSEEKLANILFVYGEERFSRRIAKNIVASRKQKPIETTLELAQIVKQSVPIQAQKNGHPAKKTFQAIRIEVNGELEGLDKVIKDIVSRLKVGGRICVITFHSLEDRIVKQTLKAEATDCICDKSFPICICNHKANVKLIGKIKPTNEELENNSRSASSTLRVAEKI